jgi:hypothetical protein
LTQLDSDSQALIVAEYRIEMRYQAVDSWMQSPKANHGRSRRLALVADGADAI